MRQSVPVWSRTLFIWRGNNLNIPCLPDPGKFRGMNTKLILYTKSFILNVVKESRVARQARHSVSFLRSLVTMAVTRPRFCPPHSSSAPLLMAVTNAPNVLTLSGSNLVKANAKWSKSQIMVHHQTSKSSHFPSRRPPISVRNLKSSERFNGIYIILSKIPYLVVMISSSFSSPH